MIGQEVKIPIIFPASDSDKDALDRQGTLQQYKEPPISITFLKVMYTLLLKVT